MLSDLFVCCGEIKDIKLSGSGSARSCRVEFTTPVAAQTAITLSGTPLGDKAILVTPGEAPAAVAAPVAGATLTYAANCMPLVVHIRKLLCMTSLDVVANLASFEVTSSYT